MTGSRARPRSAIPRRRLLAALAAGLLVGSLAGPRASAASPMEAIAGWEGDSFDQGYGFGALGVLLGDGKPTSFPIRATASYLYYEFVDGGATTRVRAPGGAGSMGLRFAGAHGAVTLAGGGEARWERRARGSAGGFGAAVVRGGVIFEGTADLRLGRRLRPFLLGTYAGSARYLFGRAAIRWQCSNLDWSGPAAWNAGIEATGQGNGDTDGLELGGLVECTLTRARLSIGARGGYKTSASGAAARRTGGYGGLSLYRRF